MSHEEHLITQAGGDGEVGSGPEGSPSYSPREIAAAKAIRDMEAEDHESDPDYPTLTDFGALRLATAAIAAAQLVDIENGIVRIRSSELQKARA